MNSKNKRNLIKSIKEYGNLIRENRLLSARLKLKEIEKNVKTDREQFFEWLEA